MKFFFIVIFFLFFNNCSFDNKTGIWNSTEKQSKKNKEIFKEFKSLSINEKNFNQLINLNKDYIFKIPKKITNSNWNDIYYNNNNNSSNFSYSENISFSIIIQKLSRRKLSKYILYDKGYVLASDIKGNIIVFLRMKINYYISTIFIKKYKKIKKKLNFILDKIFFM